MPHPASETSSTNQPRVCVPVCARRADELLRDSERAGGLGDFVELRLDCLAAEDLNEALSQLRERLATRTHDALRRPMILTFRPQEQGGRRAMSFSERCEFWSNAGELLRGESVYADVELDLLSRREECRAFDGVWNWERTICSHHDFDNTPAGLGELYERLAATPARVLKIAVRANTITDCLPVLSLLERARSAGRALVAVAMGEAGILTRVLAPSRGAFLTYGALDDERATAPGQLTADELQRLYRVHSINNQTVITGLVGTPVAHSFSPHIHNTAFAARAVNAVYIPFEVSDLDEFVRRMASPRTREVDWNLRGFSVTAPHKRAIMRRLDWVEPSAAEIGAVNTVVIGEGGELRGYNTDAAAALAPLEGLANLSGARVAVIGAGGAARALLWSLRSTRARSTVFARDGAKARATAEDFGAEHAPLDGATFSIFDIVINATPLGTRGAHENETPARAAQLRGARVVYDLVYNPSETRLMREAREAGCVAVGGLEMLVRQAAAQFTLWTGQDAPLGVMRAAASKRLREFF